MSSTYDLRTTDFMQKHYDVKIPYWIEWMSAFIGVEIKRSFAVEFCSSQRCLGFFKTKIRLTRTPLNKIPHLSFMQTMRKRKRKWKRKFSLMFVRYSYDLNRFRYRFHLVWTGPYTHFPIYFRNMALQHFCACKIRGSVPTKMPVRFLFMLADNLPQSLELVDPTESVVSPTSPGLNPAGPETS